MEDESFYMELEQICLEHGAFGKEDEKSCIEQEKFYMQHEETIPRRVYTRNLIDLMGSLFPGRIIFSNLYIHARRELIDHSLSHYVFTQNIAIH